MPKKDVKMPVMLREASFAPETLNKDDRTVEMVWSKGSRVLRTPWFDEPYYEELSMDPTDVRLDRLNGGAPLLNSHDSSDLGQVLGVVEKAWIQNGEGRAVVRFANDPQVDPIWNKVQDGIIRNVSVGYRVHKMRDVTQQEDQYQVYRAIDWEPLEVSAVAIGADAGAGFRSDSTKTYSCEIQRAESAKQGENMPKQEQPAPVATKTGDENELEAKAKAAREETLLEERTRATEISEAVRLGGLEATEAERYIKEGKSIDFVRKEVIEQVAARDEKNKVVQTDITVTRDVSDAIREGAVNAILHRVDGSRNKLQECGRQYRNLSLFEMTKRILHQRGVNVDSMSQMEILQRGFMSTSDLPAILLDAANKSMTMGYTELVPTFDPFTRRGSMPDFKLNNRIKLGDAPNLEKLTEEGEIKAGKISDENEKYKLDTYAKKLKFTRQMIINDDLDALALIPMRWGRAVRTLEGDLVWGCITGNQVMADGVALFNAATHKNFKASSGAAPDVAGLSVGRAAMRAQKGLDGQRIDTRPAFLIVPVALQTAAEQLCNKGIVPTKASDVNVFAGQLVPIAEPRLDDASATQWYLAADKNQIDTVELSSLNGQGPQMLSKPSEDSLGIDMQVIYDCAAHVIEWRGFYANVGA